MSACPGVWSIDLWDQADNVLRHCNDQISTVDSFYRLTSDVQRLQLEFGKKLRKLMTSYLPKKQPENDELTINIAFADLSSHLTKMGSIFEVGAKEIGDQVVANFRALTDSERKDLDNQRAQLSRVNQTMESTRKQLEQSWQKYVTAYRERQKAQEISVKVDQDMQLPRVEQQKAREAYNRKASAFDNVKAQYAADLEKYNNSLRQHYNKNLSDILEELELRDLSRTDRAKQLLSKLTDISEHVSNQFSECIRSISSSISIVNPLKDCATVIRRLKGSELPPVDLPFFDLDKCSPIMFDGPVHHLGAFLLELRPSQQCGQVPGHGTVPSQSGGLSIGLRKREEWAALRSPFMCDISLKGVKPCDFTAVQLRERLKDLQDYVKRTEQEVQGAHRLIDAYRNNPSLGEAKTVEPKEELCKRRLQSLTSLLEQLKDQFTKLGGEQSISRPQFAPDSTRSSNLLSGPSFNSSLDSDLDEEDPSQSAYGHPGQLPPQSKGVGRATVLYDYDGNGPDYPAAKAGEIFFVLELDEDNSGWTMVVSEDGSREGFLPTGFIEVTKY